MAVKFDTLGNDQEYGVRHLYITFSDFIITAQ